MSECSPDMLPDYAILSDEELNTLMCLIIANVEKKRQLLRNYKLLLEKLEVNRTSQSNSGGIEAIARKLIEESMSKQKEPEVSETQMQFNKDEIEDLRKTLEKIKAKQSNKENKENSN